MTCSHRHQILAMLALSSILLAALIPGGPIENRDFSHINAGVLGAFNLFLTVLNLGTIAVFYYVYKQRRWAISAAFIAALAYFVVYAIDLAQIFPRSPTPMTSALAMVEVLGICTAVPLMFLTLQYRPLFGSSPVQERPGASSTDTTHRTQATRGPISMVGIAFVIVLIGAGVGIVTFATEAAMNSASANPAIAQPLD